MSTVVSLICLGPSFQKMTHHILLHGSLGPTNLEKKSEALDMRPGIIMLKYHLANGRINGWTMGGHTRY